MAGRGRLSSIDLLPPEADGAILWAVQELLERERTQADILFELNDKLEVLGCEPVSKSAFNRFSTRKAAMHRRLSETREIARAVTESLGPESADDVTVMGVQLIKEAILEILERGQLAPKQVMELSRAMSSAVSAQKHSADNRRAAQDETNKHLEKAAEVAAEGAVEKSPSLDKAQVLASIREAIGIAHQ